MLANHGSHALEIPCHTEYTGHRAANSNSEQQLRILWEVWAQLYVSHLGAAEESVAGTCSRLHTMWCAQLSVWKRQRRCRWHPSAQAAQRCAPQSL
jgi:hypothetical protein